MPDFRIIIGDALKALQVMPEASVDCIVTSPPYWGLRDYGHAEQLGLEPTPEAFVASMVEVFRELRRVLKAQGTLWLNLGDSYAGARQAPGQRDSRRRDNAVIPRSDMRVSGLKCKDLVGMPWRVALALQADGWYLRQDIIWNKPNPMPESAKDRCTKAHEYLFLLSKSERYFFDGAAIRENRTSDEDANGFRGGAYIGGATHDNSAGGQRTEVGNKKVPAGWDSSVGEGGHGAFHRNGRQGSGNLMRKPRPGLADDPRHQMGSIPWSDSDGKRNRRSVWTIATQPFKEAHFATFPEALVMPCILAGCPEGGLVLDPFTGSGTTGVVALKTFRRFLGIELNPAYAAMATRRIAAATPGPALFNQQDRASA